VKRARVEYAGPTIKEVAACCAAKPVGNTAQIAAIDTNHVLLIAHLVTGTLEDEASPVRREIRFRVLPAEGKLLEIGEKALAVFGRAINRRGLLCCTPNRGNHQETQRPADELMILYHSNANPF
jgi:hypothetical protein